MTYQNTDNFFRRYRARFKQVAEKKYRRYLLHIIDDFKVNSKRFWSLLKSVKRSSAISTLNPPPPGLFLYPPQPGGGVGSDPPVLSRKRTDVERRTRRHSKDLDETLPNHFRKFKIEVTCQVKVRSKVKIGCFQVAYRSDLKRSIFRPKLSICTPKDQAKVLTSAIVSYLA